MGAEIDDYVTECSYFVKGHWNVEFIPCLSKWQQLLNVTKGEAFSKEKDGMTTNPME